MLEFSPLCLERLNLDNKLSQILENVESVHLDIMDGKFVLSNAFSVDQINNFKYEIPKHVHIMAYEPIKYIKNLKNINSISFHYEVGDTLNTINAIKEKEIKVGLVVNPETDIDNIFEFVPLLDRVIIMAVNPGFSGQKYLPVANKKIEDLRKFSEKIEIVVDGGMNKETINLSYSLGANSFVICSVIVKSDNVLKTINYLNGID